MEILPLTENLDSWKTAVCPICDQIFTMTQKTQKYCSRECYRRSKYTPVEKPPQTPSERARETRGRIFLPIYSKLLMRQIQPLNPRLQDEEVR